MFTAIIRIALLVGLVFGGYKLYPRFKPALQPLLTNPNILGAETIQPVINKVNDILPDNIQIPTSNPASNNQPGENANSSSNQPNSSNPTNIINNIVNEVKQKAGEAAQEQIDTVKKETGNAFCAALIETIKKQCGVQ